jgi:hypothetical protein
MDGATPSTASILGPAVEILPVTTFKKVGLQQALLFASYFLTFVNFRTGL